MFNFRSLPMMTLIILSACTSLPTVETTAQAIHQNLKKGDTIILHTLDNTRYEFKIVDITQEYIVGPRQEFAFRKIQKIEKKEPLSSQMLDLNIVPWATGIVAFLLIISML